MKVPHNNNLTLGAPRRSRLHLELDLDIRRRLEEIAHEHERSVSAELRWLTRRYVEAPDDFNI